MDPESAHNCLMRPLCRPNKASDAQPQLRHGSSYQEPSDSERQRRHSLDSGTQPRQLHRSSYQEPFNSEQQRRHSLEIGMTPRHQHRRSYQGSFHSDVQRKDSLKIVSEERKKAAAWAWYQHGGVVAPTKRIIERRQGSTREDRRNRPASRFKTEAMKNSGSALNTSSNSVWDCESTLYDSFEFQSFSEQLHRALQGVPISAVRSSLRFPGPSLHQLSSFRTQSMPHHSSSVTVPVDVQNDTLYETVDRHRYNEESHSSVAELEKKSRKSVVGRPFEIITRAIQKITGSKHTTDKACIEKRDSHNHNHFHHHLHHVFHHHYREKEVTREKEAPVSTAPSRKTLRDLFEEL